MFITDKLLPRDEDDTKLVSRKDHVTEKTSKCICTSRQRINNDNPTYIVSLWSYVVCEEMEHPTLIDTVEAKQKQVRHKKRCLKAAPLNE